MLLNYKERRSIGEGCRLLRKVYDITSKKLGKEIGYTQSTILSIESANTGSPEAAKRICKYFKITHKNLVEIGQLETPINTFLYLQRIGRI